MTAGRIKESMDKSNKRFKLFKDIDHLCKELAFIKTGNNKAFTKELLVRDKIKTFWLHFFGFHSLGNMTLEELKDFKSLLKSKVRADYKHKSLPGIIYE